jgi:hypothetical protein
MAGIIDILASEILVPGQSDFVANSAVLDVPVTGVPVAGIPFENAIGFRTFALGDNILIQKIWSVVNWGFGQGGPTTTGPHNIGIAYWDGVVFEAMPPFPYSPRVLNIPTLCDPVDFGAGLYSPMPTTGAPRQIRLTNIDLRISMVNLPADLDGETIYVQYFMQVLHNALMTA